ncbi:transglutaminase-like domain-containing protein [Actinomadura rupiterrae]|uniref:transglutaminase-like domain-containing protein n=1 Tax=Actinomadura rupiterrae TaxID=559627 RepID=UPI0020A25D87|nr:transglutaminase family protein [Actinomadura rupiterrae]MCP2343869.1 transglutaminase-like putative cysteine protease [Actinomadura rupiterrae]
MTPVLTFAAEPWEYLGADEAVDVEHPLVQSIASELRTGDDLTYARLAFEYVRDNVTHPADVPDPRVTWRASDVLEHGTGFCHAQAIALTALLRAGGIQAGLCYQRLRDGDRYFLHGLTAVLADDRWVRLDPRGVNLEFSASEDRLAYETDASAGETDYPTIYASPPETVLSALQGHSDALAMMRDGLLPSTL